MVHTAWKVPKYEVTSGPYFPAFGLNMERYKVSLRIQSKCGEKKDQNNSKYGYFSRSEASFYATKILDYGFLGND